MDGAREPTSATEPKSKNMQNAESRVPANNTELVAAGQGPQMSPKSQPTASSSDDQTRRDGREGEVHAAASTLEPVLESSTVQPTTSIISPTQRTGTILRSPLNYRARVDREQVVGCNLPLAQQSQPLRPVARSRSETRDPRQRHQNTQPCHSSRRVGNGNDGSGYSRELRGISKQRGGRGNLGRARSVIRGWRGSRGGERGRGSASRPGSGNSLANVVMNTFTNLTAMFVERERDTPSQQRASDGPDIIPIEVIADSNGGDVPVDRIEPEELSSVLEENEDATDNAQSLVEETPQLSVNERHILGTFADHMDVTPGGASGRANRQSSGSAGPRSAGSSGTYAKTKKKGKGWKYLKEVANEHGEIIYICKFCASEVKAVDNHPRAIDHLVSKCISLPTPEKLKLKEQHIMLKSVGNVRGRADCKRLFGEVRTEASGEMGSVSNGRSSAAAESGRRRLSSSRRVSGGERSSREGVSKINVCTEDAAERIIRLLMEFIIEQAVPFNVVNRIGGEPSPFINLLHELRPGFVENYLPTSSTISGRLLDEFYGEVLLRTKNLISMSLAAGFGTVMFDGWSDINGAPVINVLLRTEESSERGRKVFFLKTIYTGAQSHDASQYVRRVEEAVEEFGGFSRICAVTSDNASACVNARRSLASKYRGVVGVKDQSHVADLLMEDYDKLPWVGEVIVQVNRLASDVHKRKRLLAKFHELKTDFNERVKTANQARDCELGDSDHPLPPRTKENGYIQTSLTLKQMSNTRFASSEGVLESFVRSRPVLCMLVRQPEFSTQLYPCSSTVARMNREKDFTGVINDSEFLLKAETILGLLKPMRRYLRSFDCDDVLISRVVPLTNELEEELQQIPTNSFFTEQRKAEVMMVFNCRKGELPTGRKRVKLLEDVHYAACMLDPTQAPRNMMLYYAKLRRHVNKYAAFLSERGDIGELEEASIFARKLLMAYNDEHASWGNQIDNIRAGNIIQMYEGKPMSFWVARGDEDGLAELAMRTLACSPSACAAERSFSAQKRIHSKQRNRLAAERVQKLVFSYWNLKLMRQLRSSKRMSRKAFLVTAFEAESFAQQVTTVDERTMEEDTVARGQEDTICEFDNDIAGLLNVGLNIAGDSGYDGQTTLQIEDFIGEELDEGGDSTDQDGW